MVDLMTNIKNKKNMIKCNIKTLVATSVLCVFFNGALIYGMKEEKQSHSSYQSCRFHISGIFHSENEKNIKETVDPEILIKKLNDNEDKSYKIIPKYTMEKLKMKKKTKGNILKNVQNIQNIQNIRKNILRNYKGHLSLCLCCNLFNNKEENMHKFFIKQENPELMLNIKNMSGDNKYSPLMLVKCDDKDINDPNNVSNGKMFEMKAKNSEELKNSKKEE